MRWQRSGWLWVGAIFLLALIVVVGAYVFQASRRGERVEGLSSFVEKFTGETLNASLFAKKSTGGGVIKQKDQLVTSGKGTNKKIWNVFYTKDDANFKADFTSQARVTLKQTPPLDGDVMAILGVEKRTTVTTGENSGINCELSIGSHASGAILRMENTAGQGSSSVSVAAAGTMKLSYNAQAKTVTCSFGEAKLSLPQTAPTGQYALTLRSGLHKIVVQHAEDSEDSPSVESVQGGTGNFTATFDDWQVTMKK